jgi:hypothetical protein
LDVSLEELGDKVFSKYSTFRREEWQESSKYSDEYVLGGIIRGNFFGIGGENASLDEEFISMLNKCGVKYIEE